MTLASTALIFTSKVEMSSFSRTMMKIGRVEKQIAHGRFMLKLIEIMEIQWRVKNRRIIAIAKKLYIY